MSNKNKKKPNKSRMDSQSHEEDFTDIGREKGFRKQNRRNRRHNEKRFIKEYGKEIDSFDEDYR